MKTALTAPPPATGWTRTEGDSDMGQIVRFVGAAAALALVWALAFDKLDPDEVGAAAGLLVLAAVLVAVSPKDWRDLVTRLKKAKLGPVDLEFDEIVKEAKEAARSAPSSEGDPDSESGVGEEATPDDLLTLRLKLEAKMAYIAKCLLGDEDEGRTTFVTVGSLHYDGLLTDQEAHTATRVLTFRDEDLATIPARVRTEFLRAADQVVTNLRAAVFFGVVRRTLERKRKDNEPVWKVKGSPSPREGGPT